MTELLTTKDVCDYLRCSQRSVSRMVADGLLHPVRLRGLVRFRRSELESLTEAFGFDPSAGCQCETTCACGSE